MSQFLAEDGHLPVHYRPEGVDRFETPADVCSTCSDFERGRLVPVSFCPIAARKTEEESAFWAGGPEPEWWWTTGPDAFRATFAAEVKL